MKRVVVSLCFIIAGFAQDWESVRYAGGWIGTSIGSADWLVDYGITIPFYYGLAVVGELSYRIARIPVLVEYSPGVYYQVWERRNLLGLGVEERLPLLSWMDFHGGIKGNLTWVGYKGWRPSREVKGLMETYGGITFKSARRGGVFARIELRYWLKRRLYAAEPLPLFLSLKVGILGYLK